MVYELGFFVAKDHAEFLSLPKPEIGVSTGYHYVGVPYSLCCCEIVPSLQFALDEQDRTAPNAHSGGSGVNVQMVPVPQTIVKR